VSSIALSFLSFLPFIVIDTAFAVAAAVRLGPAKKTTILAIAGAFILVFSRLTSGVLTWQLSTGEVPAVSRTLLLGFTSLIALLGHILLWIAVFTDRRAPATERSDLKF
jgi:hypothetical protein